MHTIALVTPGPTEWVLILVIVLVLFGATGMGTAVKYFPRPVIVGFTNGIAILIASTQIRDLFGLRMDHVPGDFFHRMQAFAQSANTISWQATAVALASLAIMIVCLKYAKRVPGAIIVTFAATAKSERELEPSTVHRSI